MDNRIYEPALRYASYAKSFPIRVVPFYVVRGSKPFRWTDMDSLFADDCVDNGGFPETGKFIQADIYHDDVGTHVTMVGDIAYLKWILPEPTPQSRKDKIIRKILRDPLPPQPEPYVEMNALAYFSELNELLAVVNVDEVHAVGFGSVVTIDLPNPLMTLNFTQKEQND